MTQGISFNEMLKNKFLYEERKFGIVFDRCRVAHFADACLQMDDQTTRCVDGLSQFSDVETWVNDTCKVLSLTELAVRHPLHSLCPYFAVFPEDFVAKQIYAYTQTGDIVFDPFSGRGTTVFESLLNGRPAAGVDVNPVAACISGAKADPPRMTSVRRRLTSLESQQKEADVFEVPEDDFFTACFHPQTFQQLLFLREQLDWSHSRVDRFISARTARLSSWRVSQVSELFQ